ncbi:MAG: hypothetical protein IH840_05235, partial [Candidatus Heimdallarchaeota archaeon]|nr:hypothetical protein [Candidatus Heimdallarchaeota archaeon]
AISSLDSLNLQGDEATGVQIVRRALEAPSRRIVENAGEEGSVIINKILAEYNHLGPIWGFNSWNILRAEAIDLIDFAVDEGEIKMPESHSMEILKRNR